MSTTLLRFSEVAHCSKCKRRGAYDLTTDFLCGNCLPVYDPMQMSKLFTGEEITVRLRMDDREMNSTILPPAKITLLAS